MTFAALKTINDLLVEEKRKAELLVDMHKFNYNEELDKQEERLGSRAKAIKELEKSDVATKYADSKSHWYEVTDALVEFQEHDWR